MNSDIFTAVNYRKVHTARECQKGSILWAAGFLVFFFVIFFLGRRGIGGLALIKSEVALNPIKGK
jgi:hypothetical protein